MRRRLGRAQFFHRREDRHSTTHSQGWPCQSGCFHAVNEVSGVNCAIDDVQGKDLHSRWWGGGGGCGGGGGRQAGAGAWVLN
jgi:hypothetical protein